MWGWGLLTLAFSFSVHSSHRRPPGCIIDSATPMLITAITTTVAYAAQKPVSSSPDHIQASHDAGATATTMFADSGQVDSFGGMPLARVAWAGGAGSGSKMGPRRLLRALRTPNEQGKNKLWCKNDIVSPHTHCRSHTGGGRGFVEDMCSRRLPHTMLNA